MCLAVRFFSHLFIIYVYMYISHGFCHERKIKVCNLLVNKRKEEILAGTYHVVLPVARVKEMLVYQWSRELIYL